LADVLIRIKIDFESKSNDTLNRSSQEEQETECSRKKDVSLARHASGNMTSCKRAGKRDEEDKKEIQRRKAEEKKKRNKNKNGQGSNAVTQGALDKKRYKK
jgi:hypothetical protein